MTGTQHKRTRLQAEGTGSVSFAEARNFEREAVIDERAIMRDALRRGMGEVTHREVVRTSANAKRWVSF